MSPESPVPPRCPQRLRVLVLNHHPEVLHAITRLLSGFDELVIIGQARNGPSALALAAQVFADVALVDLDLEPNRGAEIAAQIGELLKRVRIVLTTQVDCDARLDLAAFESVDRIVEVKNLHAELPGLIAQWRESAGKGAP